MPWNSDAILSIYRHYVGGIASLSYIIILFAQPMFEVMIRSNLYFRAGRCKCLVKPKAML